MTVVDQELTQSDLERLRRSLGVSRALAWAIAIACGLMAAVLGHGTVVAWTLGRAGTAALGGVGLAVVLGLAALTLGLVRRQRRILEAGETLLRLRARAAGSGDP